jgi:hypothetical protein
LWWKSIAHLVKSLATLKKREEPLKTPNDMEGLLLILAGDKMPILQ